MKGRMIATVAKEALCRAVFRPELDQYEGVSLMVFDWEHTANDEIGGRAYDLTQIGASFEDAVRNSFPINGVPAPVVEKLSEVMILLADGEATIRELIELVKNQ
jgi:hypothetical protein